MMARPTGTEKPARTALYRSVGAELAHYDVDVKSPTLVKRDAVMLPANVQYVWPHPSRQYLYVASSEGGPASSGAKGDKHFVSALRVDTSTGALRLHGEPQRLSTRPIHICLDATGTYALIAYNNPSGVTVHRINADGTIGMEVKQPQPLDTGIFAHQVLVTPSNRMVILVTRGNDAAGDKAEDPGALKLFQFKDGVLTNLASVAPGGGYGFGPRHLDFHPTRPWVYASIERQNKLHVYQLQPDGLSREPVFARNTLAGPLVEKTRQLAGAIHIHPNGKFVYVSNRADTTMEFDGRRVFRGGENSIAVYSIDQTTGEPTLIQHADPRGFHVRTFAIDPSGRMLVAASLIPLSVREGSRVVTVPAGLAVFRITDDGKLDFVRKYDVDTGGKNQFWMGIVGLTPAVRA